MGPAGRTPPAADGRTDEELVQAVAVGDLAAFEALYHRYREWTVRLARHFTGEEDLALDVLQETFSYFLGRFPGFELRARMTTFLYPVVRHLALRARDRARRTVGDAPLAAAEDVTAADTSHSNSDSLLSRDLRRLMDELPEGQREAVLLRFVDGLSLEETARALGTPLGTVKSRLHLALARLREDPATRAYFEQE